MDYHVALIFNLITYMSCPFMHFIFVIPILSGKMLMEDMLCNASNRYPDTTEIYLHVQQGNEDAIALYKSFGFVEGETVLDYYRRVEPPHATIFRKILDQLPVEPQCQ